MGVLATIFLSFFGIAIVWFFVTVARDNLVTRSNLDKSNLEKKSKPSTVTETLQTLRMESASSDDKSATFARSLIAVTFAIVGLFVAQWITGGGSTAPKSERQPEAYSATPMPTGDPTDGGKLPSSPTAKVEDISLSSLRDVKGEWSDGRFDIGGEVQVPGLSTVVTCGEASTATIYLRPEAEQLNLLLSRDALGEQAVEAVEVEILGDESTLLVVPLSFKRTQAISIEVARLQSLRFELRIKNGCEGGENSTATVVLAQPELIG